MCCPPEFPSSYYIFLHFSTRIDDTEDMENNEMVRYEAENAKGRRRRRYAE
jgi:hypothetical protein